MALTKSIIRAGTGPRPVKGQTVTVHFIGYGKDGDPSKKFSSSKDPGSQPISFKVGGRSVIIGLDDGVLGMKVGEIARFECSPNYAYGVRGFPAYGILPNSRIAFEVELLNIQSYRSYRM